MNAVENTLIITKNLIARISRLLQKDNLIKTPQMPIIHARPLTI